jgi:glycosyltransferase involved in cell wall biosynthesis
MKINILQKLKEGAWGGGNQFLKALRKEFIKLGAYEDDPRLADVVLFNSFPWREEHLFRKIAKLKRAGKIIIHRVDGPISEIRGGDLKIDKIIFSFNNLFADGTVFQSNWSRAENYKLGMKKKSFETVISNAPDADIFNRQGKSAFNREKTKLIATSWSANPRKGFELYKYLDANLDFSKYQMSFFGNSPVEFKNIVKHNPINSQELAAQLKNYDIFITASEKDPCSNSLIEALSCGLPAVYLNDGGHPEIVKGGGEFFEGEGDILAKIDQVADNYEFYQARIQAPSMEKIARDYLEFIKNVYAARAGKVDKISNLNFYRLLSAVYLGKFSGLVKGKIAKMFKK